MSGGKREHDTEGIEVEAMGTKVRMRGYRIGDVAMVGLLCGVMCVGYMLWEHKALTSSQSVEISSTLRELSISHRFMACVLAQPQERREIEFANESGFCSKMAKLK